MELEILAYPDARLREVCKPVSEITSEIRELADNMLETMYKARGVGLAAPQVGRSIRLIVMDPAAENDGHEPAVFVNPVVEPMGEVIVSPQEGCLSVPLNFRADVSRCRQARVQALDLDGNKIDVILEGFPAIVIQHEADHLDGKLFIDHISHLRRNIYDNKVKKWQKLKKSEE